MVRCGRVRETASASSPAQGGRRCLGRSVPANSPGAWQRRVARRRASRPCPVLPSVRSFSRFGSCRFPHEIGDISRSLPSHSGHPHSAPQKQLPIIEQICREHIIRFPAYGLSGERVGTSCVDAWVIASLRSPFWSPGAGIGCEESRQVIHPEMCFSPVARYYPRRRFHNTLNQAFIRPYSGSYISLTT